MPRRSLLFTVVAACLAGQMQALSATTQPATKPVVHDLSTPRAAAKAYAEAVLGTAADPKVLKAVTTGDEKALKQAEAAASHAAATYDFSAAAASKFGDEGRRYSPGREADYARLVDLIAKARISEDGDRATLMGAGGDFQLVLRKSEGVWKVELPKALDGSDEHGKMISLMNAQAVLLHQLAAEVRDGKYASVNDLDLARRERAKALLAGMKPK